MSVRRLIEKRHKRKPGEYYSLILLCLAFPIGFMRDFVLKKVRSKADKEDAPKKGCLTKTFLGHPLSPSKVLVLQGKTETIYDLSLVFQLGTGERAEVSHRLECA